MAEKVLITGGLGFVGSHITDHFIKAGYDVAVIDNLQTGKKENANPAACYYEVDIRDEQGLKEVFTKENPDYIVHQAAQSNVPDSIKDPIMDGETNIIGTIKLLELAKQWQVKKFVYASSASVYGEPVSLPVCEDHPIQPMSFYGMSKYTPEEYIRLYHDLYGLSYTIFRYANIYGPRQDPHGEGGVISIFVDTLLAEKTLTVFGDGEQTRDFIYVGDIAEANVLAVTQAESGVFNLSSNTQTSLNQLIEVLSNVLEKPISPQYKEARVGDIYHSYLSNEAVIDYLNWRPRYTLQEGLQETMRYYKDKK